MIKSLFGLCLAASSVVFTAPMQLAHAAQIEVKMLNKGTDGGHMVFEPAAIKAEVGDVIRFIPTDRGHDVASIKDLVPDGVQPFKSKINQPFEVTVSAPGLYVVKCTPHFSMGMVAVISAGESVPGAAETIRTAKMPKKAQERIEEQLTILGQ